MEPTPQFTEMPSGQWFPCRIKLEEVKMIISEAEAFVQCHFERIGDPSHDWDHVRRVRDNAFRLRGAVPLKQLKTDEEWTAMQLRRVADDEGCTEVRCDYLVLELAALFHDLVDHKLVPRYNKQQRFYDTTELTEAVLNPFWGSRSRRLVAERILGEQKRRVVDIIVNVGWKKDENRRRDDFEEADFKARDRGDAPLDPSTFSYAHLYEHDVFRWPEFRAVSDADRLDAIGAIGLMRCAAYSGRIGRTLLITDPNQRRYETAFDHILLKLARIKGDRLFHLEAKLEAERRQAVIAPFILSILREADIRCEDYPSSLQCQQERAGKRRRTQAGTGASTTQSAADVDDQESVTSPAASDADS